MIIVVTITIIIITPDPLREDLFPLILILPVIGLIGGMVIPIIIESGDPTRTMRIKNVEKRSKALMKHGVDKLLEKTDAKLISETKRGNQLYVIRTLIKNRELKFLKYKDLSTERIYGCFVPDKIRDADEAMAWKFNIESSHYEKLLTES